MKSSLKERGKTHLKHAYLVLNNLCKQNYIHFVVTIQKFI